ncbi:MAG TPA: flagellar hook-length control protein FliK [Chloroflexota bacterium]|nr:flagellar hook-length control protein FliK [Chloroflexota bacterium]
MVSTVPGVDREGLAAKLGIGVQAPDLTGLAAPTISLTPTAPGLKLGQLRRTGKADRAVDASPVSGDSFAATLARTIAARKTANQQVSRASRPSRVEARQEREHAVRDVVRQLKQLVETVRDAVRDAVGEAKSPSGTPPQQAGEAIAHNDLEVDAAALQSAFERLTGTTTDASPAAGEDPSLAQPADVEALLQTVANAIAQAMTPEGEIDEATLAAALLADPLVLAAAEALIAALQVQLVTAVPVALPAAQTDGDTAAGEGKGSIDAKVVTAAQPGAASVSAGSNATEGGPTAGATAEALNAPAAAPGETVAARTVAAESNPAGTVAEVAASVAPTVEFTRAGESAPTPTNSTVQPTVETAPSAAPAAVDPSALPSTATAVVESIQTVPSAIVVENADVSLPTTAAAVVTESEVAGATVSSGAEASAPTPTSGEPAAAILAQTASGQTGAQAAPGGQRFEDGGDATIEATASAQASASAPVATGADADGAVPSGQSAAASVQSTGSGPSAGANSTPTASPNPAASSAVAPRGTPGNTAPAARAEGVTQSQGAQDSAPDVELHEQVSPVIVRQARLIAGNSGHELTVRLNPDHLGPLHVRISLLDGALSVGLTTANSEAQRALENALPQLRGALVESGLRLDRLDVSQRAAGNGGNDGQSGNQRGSANAGRNGGQSGYPGNEGRQSNAGAGTNGNASFADVLLDQDGRAFGSASSRGARWLGYRAYRRG